MDRDALLDRARGRGVNPLVYWVLRAILQPFFHVWFRLSRIGREHIPAAGPVIIAANHRSFLDPFVIARHGPPADLLHDEEGGCSSTGRSAWLLERARRLPDRPRRGRPGGDGHDARRSSSAATASSSSPRARARGRARSGARSAASGAWRSRPARPSSRSPSSARRPSARAGASARTRSASAPGAPLTFPKVERAQRRLAAAVTDRIWPCVELQWEWLGGTPRVRRAAVIGAGAWGTSLARRARARRPRGRPRRPHGRAGRAHDRRATTRPARRPAARRRSRHRGGRHRARPPRPRLPRRPAARRCPRSSPRTARRIPARAGVLVLAKGLVAARSARCRCAYVAERTTPTPSPASAAPAPPPTRSPRRRARRRLRRRGLPRPARRRPARRPLRRAAHHRRRRRRARRRGPQRRRPRRRGRRARGRQRGRRRRRQGARRGRRLRAPPGGPRGLADLAGAGDLVATVGRHQRDSTGEALDDLPLLAVALREDGARRARRSTGLRRRRRRAASSPSAGPPP